MKLLDSFIDYLRSSRSELEKISWPSKHQTIRYSATVLGVSLVIGVFFAGLDFGLSRLVDVALSAKAPAITEPAAPAPDITIPEQPDVTVSSGTTPLFAPSANPAPQQ